MKFAAPLLALSTLVLGIICLLQWDKLNDQQSQIAALRGEVDAKARELYEMDTARKQIEQQHRDLLRQLTNSAAATK